MILFLLSAARSIDWMAIAKCRERVEQIVLKLQFKVQLFFLDCKIVKLAPQISGI